MKRWLLGVVVALGLASFAFVPPPTITQSQALHTSFRGEGCFLTADQTSTSTSFANLTGCSPTIYSGHKYMGQIVLFVSDSTAADGVKVDLNGGTATATNIRAHVEGLDSALTINTQITSLSTAVTAATFTGSGVVVIYFTIEPSADGTFIPRIAQNAHTVGTLTVARGSGVSIREYL
jgi:hypothetical protein